MENVETRERHSRDPRRKPDVRCVKRFGRKKNVNKVATNGTVSTTRGWEKLSGKKKSFPLRPFETGSFKMREAIASV